MRTLSVEQTEAYRRDGFLLNRDILSPDQLQFLQQRTIDIAHARVQLPETEATTGFAILEQEPAVLAGKATAVGRCQSRDGAVESRRMARRASAR